MSKNTDDKIVLSYGNMNIRKSDLMLLKSGQWFNDRILSFAAEYFDNEETAYDMSYMYIFAPPETEMIKMGYPDLAMDCFSHLPISHKRFIFFMLSDNSNPQTANGGTHWSLLVYQRNTRQFFHLNSVPSAKQNSVWAKKIAANVESLLRSKGAKWIELDVPKQKNSADCGLFVIEFVKKIIETKSIEGVMELDSDEITSQRSHWEKLILDKVAEVTE